MKSIYGRDTPHCWRGEALDRVWFSHTFPLSYFRNGSTIWIGCPICEYVEKKLVNSSGKKLSRGSLNVSHLLHRNVRSLI
jgi:hypothetical protein